MGREPDSRHNDSFVRPSQDCSVTYGYAFSFNRITKLNPYEYQEQCFLTVPPSSVHEMTGTHTYARCGAIEIIDGNFPARKPR